MNISGFGGTFLKIFNDGGFVMWPLLIFSVLSIIFIVERFFAIRKAKINVNEFLAKVRKELIVNRSIKAAIKVCEDYRSPVSSILKAGLLKYGQPREDVEKTIENAALYEMGRMEKNLVWLASIANVAPLLGFFGTVVGMIKSFEALADAGLSNPGLVAAGISEALITTAAGLFVAIPAQLAYNFFMSRINKFVRDIETSSNMLMETFGEMDRKGVAAEASGSQAPRQA